MATANRVYDDIEPVSTWKSEQGFEALTIYLPGFKKEQIKVQVTTTRKLRVLGERPTEANNKWIRFRKEFPIPPNVDTDSISAKFEGTKLVLKLPRPEPMPKQSLPSELPPVPKENLKVPNNAARETEKVKPLKQEAEREAEEKKQVEKAHLQKLLEEAERAKEEALKDIEKAKHCEGILTQDYRNKLNAYKEHLGGYMELMKNNNTAMNAGMVAPAAVVLLLSIGFCYAGGLFTHD